MVTRQEWLFYGLDEGDWEVGCGTGGPEAEARRGSRVGQGMDSSFRLLI